MTPARGANMTIPTTQSNCRKSVMAAFVAGSLCALPPCAARAEGTSGSSRAQSTLYFQVVIPAVVRVKDIVHPPTITIGPGDIAQGYIELDNASVVTLTSNNRDGFSLVARYDANFLSHIEVHVGGQRALVTSGVGGLRVQSPILHDAPVAIGFRLYFHSDIVPGKYKWPVALTLSALAG